MVIENTESDTTQEEGKKWWLEETVQIECHVLWLIQSYVQTLINFKSFKVFNF
jgi:hypothetical protein